MKKRDKKAQVTIFIILAIVIVGLGLLAYSFYPQIKATFITELKNPNAFMENCMEEDLSEAIDKISLQGGSLEPEFYYSYFNDKIKYLCYTNEYFKPCITQEPMLKETIEEEIKNAISIRASECLDELKKTYERQGYQVTLKKGDTSVELLPKRIVVTFDSTLSLRKDTTESYDKMKVILNNNLYELVGITISILNLETTLGDAEITTYMNFYHDLKVEKIKQSEGTTIYILTDLNNGKKFQFASRSMAWRPGY